MDYKLFASVIESIFWQKNQITILRDDSKRVVTEGFHSMKASEIIIGNW